MGKDYSGKLRKIMRRTQERDRDKEIKSKSKLMILEDKIIWNDGNALTVDDPVLIKSLGGREFIYNLDKAPAFYDLHIINNSIHIVNGKILEEQSEVIENFLKEKKSEKITIKEFEMLRSKREIPLFKLYREYLDYIQKIFSDRNLETYLNENIFLSFFDKDDLRAILV
jgi:hypothetical protein